MQQPLKDRKGNIGVDMTASRCYPKRVSTSLEEERLWKKILASNPTKGKPIPKEMAPKSDKVLPRSSVVEARIMRKLRGEQENAPKMNATRAKTAHAPATRRCIVKIDFRTGAKGDSKSRALISARLAPFMKSGGGTITGARVGYINRKEALDGTLFSAKGNLLIGYTGEEAGMMFGSDPTIAIILSPEDPGMDLIEFTKRFMSDVYTPHSDAAPRFWCAAIHGNTKHRHVHIIASTVGEDGHRNATIREKYVHSGALQGASERILMNMHGMRSWNEVADAERRKRRELSFTWQDGEILRAGTGHEDGSIDFEVSSIKDLQRRQKIEKRLRLLRKNHLAENNPNTRGLWHIKAGVMSFLRRSIYANAFGLTDDEISRMAIDEKGEKPYRGTIIESADAGARKMVFMIRDENGKIHLREENIWQDAERDKLSSLSLMTIEKNRLKDLEKEAMNKLMPDENKNRRKI